MNGEPAFELRLLLHDGEDSHELSREEARLIMQRFLPIRTQARHWQPQMVQGTSILIFQPLASTVAAYLKAVADDGERERGSLNDPTEESVISKAEEGSA